MLLLSGGEVFVRAFISSPLSTQADEELGWVYRPGAIVFQTKEGWATTQMNSLGYNDDEIPVTGVARRVLVVGDSYTEALQVDRADNFCSLAEKRMPGTLLFNAGRSGLSPVHYPVVARRLAGEVRPDAIMMVVTSGDLEDIQAGNFIVSRDAAHNIVGVRPKAEALTRARMIMEPVLANSALATHLVARLRQMKFGFPMPFMKDAMAKTGKSPAPPPLDKEEILGAIFSEMQRIAPLKILYVPRLEYSSDNLARETETSSESFRIIENVARRAGVSIVTALPMLIEAYRMQGQPPVGFHNNNILSGHLNERGHIAVSAAVEDLLDAQN